MSAGAFPAGREWILALPQPPRTAPNCLPPDQRVCTPLGYRPVADVAPGDQVLTALGRPRPVLRVHWAEVRVPLWRLRTAGGHLLRATAEHPVLARLDEGLPAWVPLGGLRAGGLVALVGATVLATPAVGWRRPRTDDGWGLATVAQEAGASYRGLDWSPAVELDAAPYVGVVCDLDIAEDQSFVSDGVVCGGWAGF